MAKNTKAGDSAQVRRLREALAREKAKSAALATERTEAREQQAASAAILKVISRSPENAQPVFDAIVHRALRLLQGQSALVTRIVDGELHLAAHTSTNKTGDAALRRFYPRPIVRGGSHGDAIHSRLPTMVVDTEKLPTKRARAKEIGRARGYRSFLVVPLLNGHVAIGTVSVARKEPGVFAKHQIELLKTFAEQAVIAIENVRRFDETKEALARQAATAEILKVISASPTNIQPVLDAICKSAARLCSATDVLIRRLEGNVLRAVAHIGPIALPEKVVAPLLSPKHMAGRAVIERRTIHVHDVTAPEVLKEYPEALSRAQKGRGFKSLLIVPLIQNNRGIGLISIRRLEKRPFSAQQISLLQSFAAQAVIAIENVRLFNETKEALERQTATAEILRVISGSPANIQPVFDAIAENAARFCGAVDVLIHTVDGPLMRRSAHFGPIKTVSEARPIVGGTPGEVAILERRTVHVEDMVQAFKRGDYSGARDMQKRTGFRTILSVPLMRENAAIGVISMRRQEVRPFTTKEIELAETFAAQAVIAIENVRLFNETKEALERQTASSEILHVVARSVADAQPVFQTILASLLRLFEGFDATVWTVREGLLVSVVRGGATLDARVATKIPVTGEHPYAVALRDRRVLRLDDVTNAPDISEAARADLLGRNRKAVVLVPLLREGSALGALSVSRATPYPFTAAQVELLKNFADQATIAIENARLFNETKEALERQTATAEILKVMSASQTDVQPVLEVVAENAGRLCEAQDVSILESDGEVFRVAAFRGDARLKLFDGTRVTRGSVAGRAILDGRLIQVEDITAEAEGEFAVSKAAASSADSKTMLATPLLREGRPIGAIFLRRTEVRPFSAKQVELLRTFADQAAIAIENVRLFNETREALQRQTATAEILKVIAGSPTNVQPVFDVIVQRAVQLCGARFGRVYRYDGSIIEMVAGHGLSAKGLRQVQQVFPRAASDDTIVGRVILAKQPFFVQDIEQDDSVPELSRQMIAALDTHSQVTVPMLRSGEPIGAITMGWEAPRAFDDQKVELLQTFADQAVIAIENVRLFNETKEALERQTAISEILRVISSSPGDVQPVLQAVAERAARICEAQFADIVLAEGDTMRVGAAVGDLGRPTGEAIQLDRSTVMGRSIVDRKPVHIADLQRAGDEFPLGQQLAMRFGHRTILAVPLLREDRALGTIVIRRTEVRPIEDKHVSLLQTFADQAALAIENARLFNETKEALDRQTATSEVLKTISRSTFDLNAVLQVLIENATRLAGANQGFIFRFDGEVARMACSYNAPADYTALISANPIRPGRGALVARALLEQRPVHIPDVLEDKEFTWHEAQRLGGFRSMLGVPMMREGNLIGVIAIWRAEVLPFTDKQIELVSTFADQAVIAIENVRLFNETKESLERQTATAEILKVMADSPSDVQPVFDAIVTSAARLFGRRATLRIVESGGSRRRARSEAAAADSPDLIPIDDASLAGRVILHATAMQVVDTLGPDAPPFAQANAHKWDFRANAAAPLVRDGKAIGSISVASPVPGAMSNKQMELLQTFADQAVIAIENVRLFNETREALERQTATAEILKVIGGSPTDTQPVFDAIVNSGKLLFPGAMITVARPDGETVRAVAIAHQDTAMVAKWRERFTTPLSRDRLHAAAILDARLIDFPDAEAEKDGPFGPGVRNFLLSGNRAVTIMPMLRGESAIGAISVTRAVPGPLSDKQIAILRTFADQAVIAIENVRLFTELEARNKDLGESLDQQKASAEVLDAISSSIADTQPVFDRILKSCERLFGVRVGGITILGEDGKLHLRAFSGPAREEFDRMLFPMSPDGNAGNAVAFMERRILHIPDSEAEGVPVNARRGHRSTQTRASLFAPMLWQDSAIGTIFVSRERPGPYSDKEITLLKTFADQAVIAIQNARLFNETKESLERQTATAEILKVISGSLTDVQPVFDAIVTSAARLFGRRATLRIVEPGGTRRRARSEAAAADSLPDLLPIDNDSLAGRVILRATAVQVVDTLGADAPQYAQADAHKPDFRANAVAPLLRDGKAIGSISVASPVPGAMSDKQMALLATFADQAVIAIENVRLFNETKEALDQQTATAGILGVISGSPTSVQPVFESILEHALRLCEANFGYVCTSDGNAFDLAVQRGLEDPVRAEAMKAFHETRVPGSNTALGRLRETMRSVHILDAREEPAYRARDPRRVAIVELAGARTMLAMPLLREGHVIGAVVIYRREVKAFTDKQTDLLRTFAAQAVIAIENVRLFNETKEALERQTATAEILNVMASSPSDVQPVFEAIASGAARLCNASFCVVFRFDGTHIRVAADDGRSPGTLDVIRAAYPAPPGRQSFSARAILERRVISVVDAQDMPEDPLQAERARAIGYRSILAVPMMKGDQAIGSINVARLTVDPFTDVEVELLKTFADQAVIAIENVRLFNETKEALERQTATAEILKVMSGSPTDTQPVFQAIVDSCARLFDGLDVGLQIVQGDVFDRVAISNPTRLPEGAEMFPMALDRASIAGRSMLDNNLLQIEDLAAANWIRDAPRRYFERSGFRSALSAPMSRDGKPIGAIVVFRGIASRFKEEQVALLRTFADQAVIAIENVRLFKETKEALERQTATAEILRVISASPTDIQPVLDAVSENAARLCEATNAVIFRLEGDLLRQVAAYGGLSTSSHPTEGLPVNRGRVTGRAVFDRRTIHVNDLAAETSDFPEGSSDARRDGHRTTLATPLLREGVPIGAILIRRTEVRPFSDKQIALLQTFADQAVIAIENVRLFNETKESLERQTATAEILKVIASSPSDVQPVFDAIAASARRLLGGDAALVARRAGDMLELAAFTSTGEAGDSELGRLWPAKITGKGHMGKALLSAAPAWLEDIETDPSYSDEFRVGARARGMRSAVSVPMLRDGEAIGVISVNRSTPGRFSDHQTNLLKTFADQAVIAIENVRLFNELQSRTEALSTSVRQLTALGEVGQAISSTLDLEKVLKTIATHAVRLTGLDGASIYEYDEASEEFRLQVADSFPQEFLQAIRSAPIRKGDGTVGRVAITLEPIQVPDILDKSYRSSRKDLLVAAGYRAILTVPLLREGHIIGALNVTRKVPGPFADEIVELLKTFATQSAMAIQNARLFREIAEKGKQLEEASKHKSQFLASMSHELRTPLNAILGFNEMILGDIYGEVPADMKEPLTDIQTSGKHLLRLINNVLDLAKIEAGRMELALDVYSVHDTVESVRSTLRPLAEAKGLELAVDVPSDIPLARGDGGRITQCLMNLAGNSLKFTKQGRVGISVALSNGTLTYKVQDTGIGIPADKIGGLFTEFKQTDATIASEYGGTGLGLSISKKFIEMHGGRIWAESEPGSGSTFIFEVPLHAGEASEP